MNRKSKAYQAAGDHMAHSYGYDVTLEPERLEEWILAQVAAHRDTWDIIWKAARRAEWARSQDDQEALQVQITKLMLALETAESQKVQAVTDLESVTADWVRAESNLGQTIQTSKNRGDRIRHLEKELSAAAGQLVAANKKAADAVELTKQAQRRNLNLLRANQDLRSENVALKRKLVETTALTTEGTRSLQERFDALQAKFQQGERLYDQVERESNYHYNALTLAQEELVRQREQLAKEKSDHWWTRKALQASTEKRNELLARATSAEAKLTEVPKIALQGDKYPRGDGWVLAWTRMTGQTITGTVTEERTPLVPCKATTGRHTCMRPARAGGQHPDRHQCHCGTTWS